MEAVQQRLYDLLVVPIDPEKVKWEQLWSFGDFKWKHGETPFSHFQFNIFMAVFYISSIYVLKAFMKDRKPYSLKYFSLLHNAFLSLLSLAMFLGATYGAYLKLQSQGFWAGLLCEQEKEPMHGVLWYWSYIFYMSKWYEFIDTWLLILKGKPVIFLHAWHHLTMPFVCWAGLEGKWAMALWTSTFWNSFVHVIMYAYYFLATIGIDPWWKKYLTMLQIYQFVSGVIYTSAYFYYYFDGLDTTLGLGKWTWNQGCTGELWAISYMFFVNNSFLVLFMKFYFDTYKKKRDNKKKNIKKE
eukprot:TRINITY_DN12662_c0_g1_i1.p1 TRINITY_DN12662_c0_g1~~TRINITY_DN12662_c0_g1_i1.p1  ORF type:complete len:298 (+),score=70.87 TRINITY_DN12662_c0_g1_i1:98-991(+)